MERWGRTPRLRGEQVTTRSRRAVLALGAAQDWPAVLRRLTARVNALASPRPQDRPSRWT